FFFSSRRRHTRSKRDWSSDVCSSDLLLVAVDDASAGQVIRRQLHYNTVLWENTDVVLTHLAGNVSKDLVPMIELDTEHCVWQRLDDAPLYLNCAFLRHHLYFSGRHFRATTCILICLLPDAANTRCRVRIHHRHSLRVSCWFSKCMLNASRWSAPVASVCCLWGLLVPTFGRGAAADPVEIDPVVS